MPCKTARCLPASPFPHKLCFFVFMLLWGIPAAVLPSWHRGHLTLATLPSGAGSGAKTLWYPRNYVSRKNCPALCFNQYPVPFQHVH